MEEVVGAFDAAVASSPGGVPGEDAGLGSEQRVDDLVELGQVAGLVEIDEPVQGGEGAGLVVGEVQAVELAERLPHCTQAPQARVSREGCQQGLDPISGTLSYTSSHKTAKGQQITHGAIIAVA